MHLLALHPVGQRALSLPLARGARARGAAEAVAATRNRPRCQVIKGLDREHVWPALHGERQLLIEVTIVSAQHTTSFDGSMRLQLACMVVSL